MRKLNCHGLLRSLNLLCSFLDENYFINSGGCCYLSYLIAKHLDKLGVRYDLVIYDNCEKDASCIEYEVLNKHSNKGMRNSVTGNHACNHYCIQITGAGIVNDDEEECYKYVIPTVSPRNIKWIYNHSRWNDCYDVQHNKTIKNIVKHFFKEYEKVSNF